MTKVFQNINYPDLSITNNKTGEEIKKGISEIVVSNTDQFMMFFLNSLKVYENTFDNKTIVLFCCWKYSTYSEEQCGNLITNDKTFKEQIALEGFNLSDGVVNNCITQLTRKGLLIKKNRGRYMLNPQLFFKGKITDRTTLVHTLSYTPIEPNENFDK